MTPPRVERFILLRALLKPAAVLLLLVGICYGGIVAYLYSHQRQLIYFPQYTRQPAPPVNFDIDSDGISLSGWVINAGRRDATIYFGGNGEAVQANADAFARLTPERSTYLLPYRGYAQNPGEPSQDALFADALRLFESVRARHPDGRIAVVGRSLGTGVASYLASKREIERLVLVTPFDSMVSVAGSRYPWLPIGWMLEERYESDAYLAGVEVPVLVLRAGRDEIIPADATDRLIDALHARPEVLEFPGAGHNTIDRFSAYWPTIGGFLATAQASVRLPAPAPESAGPLAPAPAR